jgi:hypothetical protein
MALQGFGFSFYRLGLLEKIATIFFLEVRLVPTPTRPPQCALPLRRWRCVAFALASSLLCSYGVSPFPSADNGGISVANEFLVFFDRFSV